MGDIMMHVGDIMSTVEGVQYRGGNLLLFEYPMVLNTPMVLSPIFKNGDAEELGNYRPISIISAIARIFEKLIYNQLYEFLQRNEVLGNHQWGFRSLHSTALALIDCSNNWLIKKKERIFLYSWI